MRTETWLKKNTSSLVGKKVAVTGSTGGIGIELCHMLASLGASLILVNRNREKTEAQISALREEFPSLSAEYISADLSDIDSVKEACEELKAASPNIFIHNAGAYSISRYTTPVGLDNVFVINFLSPYYMIRELLPTLRAGGGHVEIMGSIAHRYSKTDESDIDFSGRTRASRVYGNAKRYLMFSIFELAKQEKDVTFSVVHPGITFTNITAHYPKMIFALIKHPMKIIFQKPRRAALSAILGLFTTTEYHEWIGPSLFDVWGLPKKKKLRSVSTEESKYIGKTAETLYIKL